MARKMRIAVTKLKEKSHSVKQLFKKYGHEAVIVSTMEAKQPSDPNSLSHLIDMYSRDEIDILIFTSEIGVDRFFKRVKPNKKTRIVSVGPKTAKKVREFGAESEVIKKFSSEHFAEYFSDLDGKKIGIARAEVPNQELLDSLRKKGAIVFEAIAYKLVPTNLDFSSELKNIDAIIFTSAKSFDYFKPKKFENIKLMAIGEKTSNFMKKQGFTPDIVGNGTLESCLVQSIN